MRTLPLVLTCALGCKPLVVAEEGFSDSLVTALRQFDAPDEELLPVVRNVFEHTLMLDLEASNVNDRAVAPAALTAEDVETLATVHGVDPAEALPMAVGGMSAFPVVDHARIQLNVDQTPTEPYSPEHYVREILAGEDCWLDRTCLRLDTHQELTKENILLTVPYSFFKDFRWLDMNLGLDDEPAWAVVARSWQEDSYSGESGKNTLVQSYTVEFWLPDGEGRTVRLLSLWSGTELSIAAGDDMIVATTKSGIDRNFRAVEEFLALQIE